MEGATNHSRTEPGTSLPWSDTHSSHQLICPRVTATTIKGVKNSPRSLCQGPVGTDLIPATRDWPAGNCTEQSDSSAAPGQPQLHPGPAQSITGVKNTPKPRLCTPQTSAVGFRQPHQTLAPKNSAPRADYRSSAWLSPLLRSHTGLSRLRMVPKI